MNRETVTQDWYDRYYAARGPDHNDLRSNRGVLFQTLAAEASVVRACRAMDHDPGAARVLDVGCGGGGDLHHLLRLHYRPENVTGIDIQSDRINTGRYLHPNVTFVVGDASRMEFEDNCFDLVFESTMFATLPDDELCRGIGGEMIRVCKPGGYLLLLDWRTPKPRDPNYKALTRRRLFYLFRVGTLTRLLGTFRGALIPPLGRPMSARLPSCYFLTAALFPFLVGQVAYLLEKTAEHPEGGPA